MKGKRGPRPGEGEDTKLTVELAGEKVETTAGELMRAADAIRGQIGAMFKEAKLLRDKEGHQLVRADFTVIVSDENVEQLPGGIAAEWRGMKAERLLTEVSIDGKKLPVQVVEARMWPDKPKIKYFRAIGRLDRVRLTEVKDKNTSWIELRVSIARGKDAELWDWLSDNYPGSSVWLRFEDAQGELLERFLDDEED